MLVPCHPSVPCQAPAQSAAVRVGATLSVARRRFGETALGVATLVSGQRPVHCAAALGSRLRARAVCSMSHVGRFACDHPTALRGRSRISTTRTTYQCSLTGCARSTVSAESPPSTARTHTRRVPLEYPLSTPRLPQSAESRPQPSASSVVAPRAHRRGPVLSRVHIGRPYRRRLSIYLSAETEWAQRRGRAAATVESGPAPALRPRASAAPFKLFALKGCEDLIKANPEEARRCAAPTLRSCTEEEDSRRCGPSGFVSAGGAGVCGDSVADRADPRGSQNEGPRDRHDRAPLAAEDDGGAPRNRTGACAVLPAGSVSHRPPAPAASSRREQNKTAIAATTAGDVATERTA